MRVVKLFSSLSVIAVLGACGTSGQDTTRDFSEPMSFQQPAAEIVLAEDQARMLNRMADQLVRRSTVRGAATGTVIGCGVAVVTAGNARGCAVSAASGGALGALFGRSKGQRDVDARVELISANELVRSIRGMNQQMDALEVSLPELLAEQDAELSDLEIRRDAGVLTVADYEAGVDTIRQSRARIAEALILTSEQSKQANFNMQKAAQDGQNGLDWHLSATAQLAREAESARSTISLLDGGLPAPMPAPKVVSLVPGPGVLR